MEDNLIEAVNEENPKSWLNSPELSLSLAQITPRLFAFIFMNRDEKSWKPYSSLTFIW